MITALNYAAQAINGLERQGIELLSHGLYKDTETILLVSRLLSGSVKFALPDGGKIFNDGYKGIKGQSIRLPYKTISIEWFMPLGKYARESGQLERCSKMVVLASNVYDDDKDSPIQAVLIKYYDSDGSWEMHETSIIIDHNWDSCKLLTDKGCATSFKTGIILSEYLSLKKEQHDPLLLDSAQMEIRFAAESVLELCEALSCNNVEETTHQESSPKNAQRIKSHKLPIYETKFLTIKANESKSGSNNPRFLGSHASPRQHLRRGHIRRLESGNIWVNSCVVGDGSIGKIDKEYRVN